MVGNYITKISDTVEMVIDKIEERIDNFGERLDRLFQRREEDYKITKIENLCKWKFESIWDIIFLIAVASLMGAFLPSLYYFAAFTFSDRKYRDYIVPPFPIVITLYFIINLFI
jgi:hypothetical protein